MNIALRQPWTQDDFFAWADQKEGLYEFDGIGPVEVNGGSINHNQIADNIKDALRSRLRGTGARVLGPVVSIETSRKAIRYPDVLVSLTKLRGTARIVPDPLVVFEVVSPSSETLDRVVKLTEYASVATIRRYVLVESSSLGVCVFSRTNANAPLQAEPSNDAGILPVPELGITIPTAELYLDVDLQP